MSNRKSSKISGIPVITTEDGLAAVVNEYVESSLELAKRKAGLEAQIAALNAEFDRENGSLVAKCEMLAASAQVYAESRPDLFPEDAAKGPRSRVYRNATVGFRTNPPKVEKRVSKDTWEAILQRLEATAWGFKYIVRPDPTLDKEGLLRDREDLETEKLAAAGIKISQGETFFIKPASESVETISREAKP